MNLASDISHNASSTPLAIIFNSVIITIATPRFQNDINYKCLVMNTQKLKFISEMKENIFSFIESERIS